MKRIKLVVSYDGTRYCGWQFQPNGITVEEMLNRALSELTGEKIQVVGASRTDSGVHALGNIAVFNTETRIPPEKICYAVNQRLPEDIVVQSSEEVDLSYHPRKCNSLKTYEYKILNQKFADPTKRFYSYYVHWPLDVEFMRMAASYLKGEHDFSSFCSAGSQAEDTVRKIYEASVEKDGSMITIRLTGNGFLYNMVRIIVGTLMEAGRGAWPPEHMREILNARDRNRAGVKAPAVGLTLTAIRHLECLESLERNTNDWIDYSLYRGESKENGRIYMVIHRCQESERLRMIARGVKQSFRDGASEFWVCEESREKRRIENQVGNGIGALFHLEEERNLPGLGSLSDWWVFKKS